MFANNSTGCFQIISIMWNTYGRVGGVLPLSNIVSPHVWMTYPVISFFLLVSQPDGVWKINLKP